MLCNTPTGPKHSTVKQKNTQLSACSTCTNTYSSRLDSRQAEGREEGEIEGIGVKDPAQVRNSVLPACVPTKPTISCVYSLNVVLQGD